MPDTILRPLTGENGGTISDKNHPGLDYGNVSFTRRQRFLATFLYELPFGKGKAFLSGGNAVLDRVIGGWELAGVVVAQTGPFMTILASGDPSEQLFRIWWATDGRTRWRKSPRTQANP
jgi:hypothetical protein